MAERGSGHDLGIEVGMLDKARVRETHIGIEMAGLAATAVTPQGAKTMQNLQPLCCQS